MDTPEHSMAKHHNKPAGDLRLEHHAPLRRILTYGVILFMCLAAAALWVYVAQLQSNGARSAYQTHQHPLAKKQPAHAKPKPAPPQTPTPTPPPSPPVVPDTRIPPIENGIVPVVTSLPTKQPVVFLGIDDGANKTPDELQALQANHVKATLFLARLFIANDPGFFAAFQTAGNRIEDHSLDHLVDAADIKSYAVQKEQICGMADYELHQYGQRPILFRPPGGSYSSAMRRAAADCGMKAIVTWVAKANGGSMQYQFGDHLRPGDVVLMHFRPEFQQDLKAFVDAMNSQHLHTELIEDWLPQ